MPSKYGVPIVSIMMGLGAFFSAGYFLYEDLQTPVFKNSPQSVKKNPIAKVILIKNRAQQKSKSVSQWSPLKKGQDLYFEDSIKTGPQSQVIIRFEDQSLTTLGENTLIELNEIPKGIQIHFKLGDLISKGSHKKVSIKTKEAYVKSEKNSEVHLSTGKLTPTQVEVKKGKAKMVDSRKKVFHLKPKSFVNVNQKGYATPFKKVILLETPKDFLTINTPSSQMEYSFRWTVLSKTIKSEKFQISSKRDFTPKDTLTLTAHQGVRTKIQQGPQYWRVGWSVGKNIIYTRPRFIRLVNVQPVQLQAPAHNTLYEFEQNFIKINLKWNTSYTTDHYILDLALDSDFNKIIISKKLENPNYSFEAKNEAVYYWRVRAFDPNNKLIGKSLNRNFIVKKNLPQFPKLTEPINNVIITPNKLVGFKWQADERANSYLITISKDFLQKKVIKTHTLQETSYSYKLDRIQKHYWSIKALDKNSNIIGQSQTRNIVIKNAPKQVPITLLHPNDNAEVTRKYLNPMRPVEFEWEALKPSEEKFKFLLSKTLDFKKVIKRDKLDVKKVSIVLKKNAIYYWKVQRKIPGSTSKESSLVQSFKFRMLTSLPPIKLISPKKKMKEIRFKSIPVKLKWRPHKKAQKYHLTLQKQNLKTKEKELVLEKELENNKFVTPKLDAGIYFWSVYGIDENNSKGTTSEVRSFEIEINKELVTPILEDPIIEQ